MYLGIIYGRIRPLNKISLSFTKTVFLSFAIAFCVLHILAHRHACARYTGRPRPKHQKGGVPGQADNVWPSRTHGGIAFFWWLHAGTWNMTLRLEVFWISPAFRNTMHTEFNKSIQQTDKYRKSDVSLMIINIYSQGGDQIISLASERLSPFLKRSYVLTKKDNVY